MVWCTKHKKDGKCDGMYYPKPHDHEVWFEKVKKNEESHRQKCDKQKANISSSNSPPLNSDKQKLVLNINLKAILSTNCGLSNNQVKEMVEAYNAKN
eukprot:2188694-Ditylum_brightwellii.AAC.1